MLHVRIVKLFIVIGIIIFDLAACNATSATQNAVTNITLNAFQEGQDNWIQASASINTGNFQMIAFSIPLANPADPTVSYGQLSFVPDICNGQSCVGLGTLDLQIDLTKTASLNASSPTLPNGTALPISGLDSAKVVAVPVAETGAQVYLALGGGVAIMGAAIPFAALDPAGQIVPGANLFVPLTLNSISLIAGMFFGATTETTGFGLFVDVSSIVPASFTTQFEGEKLGLKRVMPTAAEQSNIEYIMGKLNDQHLVLKLSGGLHHHI